MSRPADSTRVRYTAASEALRSTFAVRQAELEPHVEPPGIVTLGIHDVLTAGAPDPEATARPTATVHLAPDIAVVGPFPDDSGAPGPCRPALPCAGSGCAPSSSARRWNSAAGSRSWGSGRCCCPPP